MHLPYAFHLGSQDDGVARAKDGRAFEDLDVDELDELEDDEDDRVLLAYRQKRLAELRSQAKAARYGRLIDITGLNAKCDAEGASCMFLVPGFPHSAYYTCFSCSARVQARGERRWRDGLGRRLSVQERVCFGAGLTKCAGASSAQPSRSSCHKTSSFRP